MKLTLSNKTEVFYIFGVKFTREEHWYREPEKDAEVNIVWRMEDGYGMPKNNKTFIELEELYQSNFSSPENLTEKEKSFIKECILHSNQHDPFDGADLVIQDEIMKKFKMEPLPVKPKSISQQKEPPIYPDLQSYFITPSIVSSPIKSGFVCRQLNEVKIKITTAEERELTLILNPNGTFHFH